MSNELIKALATMPKEQQQIMHQLPDDIADKVLNDLDTFAKVIERQSEMYISLGYEYTEYEPMLITSIIQSYQLAR